MKILHKWVVCLALLGFTSIGFAAGGGSMGGSSGGGSFQTSKRLSPQELAIKSYNQGLKYRDKAWKYEAQAAEADSQKKKDKLMKKAQKQFVKAQKKFLKAVKKEPRLYQAHGSLGYAYRRLGEYEKSLASYNAALRLKPSYSEAIEYRAEAYLALGRLDETKEAYMNLFVRDRARADELMEAMLSWAQTADVADEKQKIFVSWINERNELSQQTADLSQQEATSWQP